MRITLLFGVLIIVFSCSRHVSGQYQAERPKLVVGIVVDQMRNEFLYRFYDDFGDNGFKRLMRDGYYYANTHYNYVPTYTAPGHASIYTGATPDLHGIVGNDWYDREEQRLRYCTEDEDHPIVGGEGKGMSCYSLRATTFTDELEMSTNKQSKVIGISLKDRGAIIPAGHLADAAYWFTDDGNFVSSTYYIDSLPGWVQQFNDERRPLEYFKLGWDKLPEVDFSKSLPDNNPYESRVGGKDGPVFPYDLTSLIKYGGIGSIRSTPYGNDLTVDFAEAAMLNEELGKDDITDVLAISFSSTDYIGHSMGPRSMEIQDVYVRLDQSIARLLTYLDERVGPDNYVLFLTSDHGAGEVPQYLSDEKIRAEAVGFRPVPRTLKNYSLKTWGENVIENVSNFNVHLNGEVLKNKKLDKNEVLDALQAHLMSLEYIKMVYSKDELIHDGNGDGLLSMVRRGYDVKLSGELVYVLRAGYMEYKDMGTTHGSPFAYDTHVPLIFFGKDIPVGKNYDKKYITQIAPTISNLLRISLPNSTRANNLIEILK